MNVSRTAAVFVLATVGVIAGAGSASAAPKTVTTLRAGLYQTPALVAVGAVMPSYVPVLKPGTYTTTRTGRQVCTLRAIGEIGETSSNLILAFAKSGTVKVAADSWVVEVTGPCVWRRK
jgi:hypothetical protein